MKKKKQKSKRASQPPAVPPKTAAHELSAKPPLSEHQKKPEVIPEITPFELLQAVQFLPPDPPKPATIDTSEPATAGQRPKPSVPTLQDKFAKARELLTEAANYLKDCNTQPVVDFAGLSGVSFDAIIQSNYKCNQDEEKLLPGIGSKAGLVKFIRRYFAAQSLRLTEEQQAEILKKTGKKLAVIEDQTGEKFIKGEFIPTSVLYQMQLWRDGRRKKSSPKRA